MSGDYKFQIGDTVLWEGFDESGGVYIYWGKVVARETGLQTGERYYACFFPQLKPYPELLIIEEELMPLKPKAD